MTLPMPCQDSECYWNMSIRPFTLKNVLEAYSKAQKQNSNKYAVVSMVDKKNIVLDWFYNSCLASFAVKLYGHEVKTDC